MIKITIQEKKCDAENCLECVDACPMEILTVEEGKLSVHDIQECNLCENCMDICPNGAIYVDEWKRIN